MPNLLLLLERRPFGEYQAGSGRDGTLEALQSIPDRFRLFPKLPPFGCAALRAHVFLQDMSTLIQEDLVDLKEPLQHCSALAPSDEHRAAIDTARQELAALEQHVLRELAAIQTRFFDEMGLAQMVAEAPSVHSGGVVEEAQ
jgi:hypothetical protein